MKKLKYLLVVVTTIMFVGCVDLDTNDLMHKNTSNYPQGVVDAQQVVAGIYNNLNVTNANPGSSFLFVANLASDDRFGGGGVNDRLFQSVDLLMSSNTDLLRQHWIDRYIGIFRANVAIETLGNVTGYTNDDQKNQMIGEAYFLRAFYYYDLASLFENVPLVVTSAPNNLPQSTPDQTWGQIIFDLKKAIELMPAQKFGSNFVEAGHANHWTAEAMLGRAFLFYTGFYNKTDVTLPDGTTKVTKADVSALLDDCVNNSGYSLVPDFRNLWAYTNRDTKNDYSYTKGQGLKWVEDDNAVNPESMFAIKFSKFAAWATTIGYSNGYALYFGVRGGQDLAKTFPFGQGWGAGPVNPGLWKDWAAAEPNDMRRAASLCNIRTELDPLGYTKGGWVDFVQETDFLDKKWTPISAVNTTGVPGPYWETFEQDMYGYASVNFQLSNIHDLVLIRFADVLLMQSELEANAAGLNLVRARAGLPAVGYSLAAIQNERRWELACEGIRWNDMRRWGESYAEAALAAQSNQPTYFQGQPDVNKTTHDDGGYVARYKATKGGFFPIPESEIALSSNVLKQNAGWGSDATYSGWK